MGVDEVKIWLATTDAEITYIGEPIVDNPLAARATQTTTVVYCSERNGDSCGGTCTVYTGPGTCLVAPNTNCLSATNDVNFCSTSGCTNPCNGFSSCGVRLEGGFCSTPGTNSIAVLS